MNFDYLKDLTDFKSLYCFCHSAESLALSQPSLSVVQSRNALESIVKSFYVAKYGSFSETATLFELLNDGHFSSYLDESMLSAVHYVRQVGNNGAHGEAVTSKQAINSLACLYSAVGELLCLLGAIVGYKPFDINVYKKEEKSSEPLETPPSSEPNKENLEKYKSNIDDSIKLKSSLEYSEYETRKEFIDLQLKEAGWDVWPLKGTVKAGKACIEVPLEGMPNNAGVGYADYVLFDNDGKPLAVIEAKKTIKDAIIGRQQAVLYAGLIEKKWGTRPVAFYTNGFSIYVIDVFGNPDRKVYGYYSKPELHSMIVRQFPKITDTRIDPLISDRPFIQEAATAVIENYVSRHRKSLVVMATGTGKTRCAISIVDILQRFNWAKRVLFLADRTALVNQAKNAFKKYLPNTTCCAISENSADDERDYDAHIVLSTYQTIMNLIDREDKLYGIAHFDLIIVDEAHRSIYNKYQAIFRYFDSLILGLTATPREDVDKSTYELFELPKGEPTYYYELETAVKEKYLTYFHPFERTTNVLKYGVKYDQLSESEKEEYEDLAESLKLVDENGKMPEAIDSQKFRSEIMNMDTIDRVLNTIMKEGMRLHNGETLGKTVIFAVSTKHADAIVERFHLLYPEKGPDFCKSVYSSLPYAQSLINEFSIGSNNFRIAVSVDMLDTGIDIPEICNLVFFKPVFSKIKFWQMIGRGTRICKDLDVFSPSRDYFESTSALPVVEEHADKQGFYIFDFCNVFGFFRMHPDGKQAASALNISQKIFELKLDMVFELQKQEHQEKKEDKAFYDKYRDELESLIQRLNRNLINVRSAIKYVETYSDIKNWDYLNLLQVKEIKKQITPLIDPDSDDEIAKYFDLRLFNMELDQIVGDKDYSKEIQKVRKIGCALLEKLSIPNVKAKEQFLKTMLSDGYWEAITITKIEKIRTEVRELVKFLGVPPSPILQSHFEDEVIDLQGGVSPKPQFKNYKERVLDYLYEHSNSGPIFKIRHLEPLNSSDVDELRDTLTVKLGSAEDYKGISNGRDFGVFVRTIVGLDRESVNAYLIEYFEKYNFNSKQQEFIHEVVNFVLENGDISPSDLTESYPFKKVDYTELFSPTKPLYDIVNFFHRAIGSSTRP
jgi:type I restriction enzyme R subunit